MWNLANGLTCSRFVMAPIMVWLLLSLQGEATKTLSWMALALLIVTLLTDMFDGIAARAQGQVTDFGKIMDPVADSTFFMTVLFGFSEADRFDVPIWMPLIVLYREVAMHVLRRYAALRGIVLPARFSGKAKMVIQSVVTAALLLAVACRDSGWIVFDEKQAAYWAVLTIVAANILSLPEYFRAFPAPDKSKPPVAP